MSWPLKRVERTIQKPHSALNRSLTSSGSKLEGRPTLIVLGGSASTLGNMNRIIIWVKATQPTVKAVQATATQETKSEPTRNPRRSARATASAGGPEGLGKTVCGL